MCRWLLLPGSLIRMRDQLCHGIELIVTDRNVVDSPELGLEIATALHKLYADKFQLNKIERPARQWSLCSKRFRLAATPSALAEDWQQQLHDFDTKRKPYLLY